MRSEELWMCVIAFILGFMIHRMMKSGLIEGWLAPSTQFNLGDKVTCNENTCGGDALQNHIDVSVSNSKLPNLTCKLQETTKGVVSGMAVSPEKDDRLQVKVEIPCTYKEVYKIPIEPHDLKLSVTE